MVYFLIFESLIIYLTIIICVKNSNIFVKYLPLIDYPDQRKLHKKPTPLIGGIIFIILILIILIFDNFIFQTQIKYEILLVSFVAFLIGLIDDIKDLSPYLKLLILSIILILFLNLNINYIVNEIYFETLNRSFHLDKFSLPFTVLCVLLLTNASNMSDGISGLFIGIFIIFFSYIEFNNHDLDYFNLSVILSLIILFYFNYKNFFFMGDSGVFFITIMFSFFLINSYNMENNNLNSVDEIFLLLMIPGLDMLRLFIERLLQKKNPLKPDRNHFHHLLLNRFQRYNVLIIYFSFMIFPLILLSFKVVSSYVLIIIFSVLYLGTILYLKRVKG